mgnify:CR=1 FL=1
MKPNRIKSKKELHQIIAKGNAKVNLVLDVRSRRPDGYHEIATVMQSLTLGDRITYVQTQDPGVTVIATKPEIVTDETNLSRRAAEAFLAETGRPGGLRIKIDSRMPIQAGLGAASADCAATLLALNKLYGAPLSHEQLMKIGARLGADVPFCLTGGTQLAEGIGDRLTPLPRIPESVFLIVKPPVGCNTAEQYGKLDDTTQWDHPDVESAVDALKDGDLDALADAMGNVFEPVVDVPDVERCKILLSEASALGTCMTGSGSAVIGLFEDDPTARRAMAFLRSAAPDFYTVLTVPTRRGVEIGPIMNVVY